MAYAPYTWENLPNVTTPISKANLDHLETQYTEMINLFDAHSILMAVADNDPAALTIAASRILGRKAAGNIVALTGAEVLEIAGWTAAKLLRGAGAGVAPTEIDVPVPTKEIFIPVNGWQGGGTAPPDEQGVEISGAAEEAFMRMLFPQDFTAITALEVIFIPLETGADMHLDITTRWGTYNGGEDYDTGTETENARDIGATVIDQYLAHDIADLCTGIAAGDLLMVRVSYDATAVDTNAKVTGLRLKYT